MAALMNGLAPHFSFISRSLPLARNAAIEAPASNPSGSREPLVSAFPGSRLETRETRQTLKLGGQTHH